MQLPSGRTVGQCITVTGQMFQGPMRIPDLKRKPMNDLLEQPPKRLAAASPMEPPAQLPPLASAAPNLVPYASTSAPSVLQGETAQALVATTPDPPCARACTPAYGCRKPNDAGRRLRLQLIAWSIYGGIQRASKTEARPPQTVRKDTAKHCNGRRTIKVAFGAIDTRPSLTRAI
ncbi:hypothetical protein CH35J_004151 [Colletotrichum higginsianum]|uniref:Uncharacterized protein n=1 Tax=Colletotrichum higginsianum TaxID=80884 RepID=A0A4T0W7E5_9PEZI|nr:hypothetical protein CH35J_004151 [Colletotrichum higginsianum]